MNSSSRNVVVLVRVAGNVFAVERVAGLLRVVKVGSYQVAPPDQREALKLIRSQ